MFFGVFKYAVFYDETQIMWDQKAFRKKKTSKLEYYFDYLLAYAGYRPKCLISSSNSLTVIFNKTK